jgi:hypothetical protein
MLPRLPKRHTVAPQKSLVDLALILRRAQDQIIAIASPSISYCHCPALSFNVLIISPPSMPPSYISAQSRFQFILDHARAHSESQVEASDKNIETSGRSIWTAPSTMVASYSDQMGRIINTSYPISGSRTPSPTSSGHPHGIEISCDCYRLFLSSWQQ